MLHIIQENLFRETNYKILISTLQKFEIEYKIVRVFPFVDKVVDIEKIPEDFDTVEDLEELEIDGLVWCWGSTKLTKICEERGWKPGTLYNKNHNYLEYSKYWKDLLVNYDSIITTIGSEINWDTTEKFLRPTEDTKAFTGAIFDKEKWENTKESFLKNEYYTKFTKDTTIQVSSVKKIQKEIRLWVVNGEIITGSYYRLGNRMYLDSNIESQAIEFAKKVIGIYSIADAWVLDICMCNDEWKIVECGCINHAGFYASEVDKMVIAVENYFNPN
jgi:hypothetical protein